MSIRIQTASIYVAARKGRNEKTEDVVRSERCRIHLHIIGYVPMRYIYDDNHSTGCNEEKDHPKKITSTVSVFADIRVEHHLRKGKFNSGLLKTI